MLFCLTDGAPYQLGLCNASADGSSGALRDDISVM